jgi:hypothetical protein
MGNKVYLVCEYGEEHTNILGAFSYSWDADACVKLLEEAAGEDSFYSFMVIDVELDGSTGEIADSMFGWKKHCPEGRDNDIMWGRY